MGNLNICPVRLFLSLTISSQRFRESCFPIFCLYGARSCFCGRWYRSTEGRLAVPSTHHGDRRHSDRKHFAGSMKRLQTKHRKTVQAPESQKGMVITKTKRMKQNIYSPSKVKNPMLPEHPDRVHGRQQKAKVGRGRGEGDSDHFRPC